MLGTTLAPCYFSYLCDVGVVGAGDELLQVGESVCLGVGKHEFCLDVRLARLLACHL